MSTSSSHNTLPPFGKYASWAAPTAIVTGILAIVGALAGGRGNVVGTVAALVLNPIAWLAIWFWFKSTKISCPHCGCGIPVTPHLETQKVGSILRCVQCRNEFRKPPMNGQQAGSVAEPVNAQPVLSRAVEPIISEGASSPNAQARRPSVHVVEPKAPPASAFERVSGDSASMLPVVATPVAPAQEQHNLIAVEAPEPEIDSEPDPVIMRVDGTSTFVTLKEHKRRGWKHAARCDLSNMNFRGVSFAGANLEGAKLDGSNFAGCDFRNAVLKNTSAKDCNFEGVDFAGANLLKTDFQDSNLTKARFCTLSGDFRAVIDQVRFGHCNMSDAMFVPVQPKGSVSVGTCKVDQSDFSGSDMSRCNLQGMDFRTCNFTDANLYGTSLQRCNFEGVDLSSANLINAHLSQVVYSDSSKFPDGFVLPGNAQNADVARQEQEVATRKAEVVRKAQVEETRMANQVLWLTLMIVAFVICSIIVVAALSKAPQTRIDSSEAESDVPIISPFQIQNSIGMDLKLMPAGTFTMGSYSVPGEQPAHQVTLTKDFYIGVYEVTQQQYERVTGRTPSRFKGANNPVESISWDEAVAFCAKLSALPAERAAGRVYRLPTEAEWEYACRASTLSSYYFGDDSRNLGKYAWFNDNSGRTTHPVGAKLPNGWGLYDMHGNVWEWCSDKEGSARVVRGGSWDLVAMNCRSASLGASDPTFSYDFGGFRLAMSSPLVQSLDSDK
jgi:formylglycine-generating enzyme required for sulfatase activity/uncharacterized protein YjbI with pentapeptide repeats